MSFATSSGVRPPASARSASHVYIAALRRTLGPGGRLTTRTPGYLLALADDQLDANRFERWWRDATHGLADGDPRAHERLRSALALWRGPALAEYADLPCARNEAARLDELRLSAVETRIEMELGGGRHAELIAELRQLVAQHP